MQVRQDSLWGFTVVRRSGEAPLSLHNSLSVFNKDFLLVSAFHCLQMQTWVVICWAIVAVVGADECPDGGRCAEGQTCCSSPTNSYGCCPFDQEISVLTLVVKVFPLLPSPKAECCEDHIHCCPADTICDPEASRCVNDTVSIPWMERTSALQPTVSKAVCCDDHLHCCPEGTTCNPTSTGCLQASASTSVMLQVAAFTTPVPTTTTQCLVTTPAESSEEDERSIQEGDDEEEEEEKEEERNQCDDHTSCPQDTTCCFMQSSQKWGCCPLPKSSVLVLKKAEVTTEPYGRCESHTSNSHFFYQAVCCADGSHCCPENYKCNEDKTTCVRGEVEIPWYTKLPAVTSVQVDPNNIQCDDDHQCPEHTSCCKLFTGEWGCCPLQNAVCCSDKEHCCPEGYTCDVVSNSCQKLILLQLETLPLTPVFLPEYHLQLTPLKHRNVQCDGQKSCPDDNTCCRTSATTWGCCPAPNAVCCSDMKHCCPSGYTCTEEGSCVKNSGFNWQTWDMFSTNKKRALIL
ncbi:hypothetical protein CCH79_00008062 [Gambusia affinis]|uniref:Granulins domain-containing protein n=1 Tax=Gambusia affinis TaxID=33528 RepID=A0A315VF72_GAMAF|nr:hypothetical protein CCH79_00008062 [Gambusia affinis]